MSEFGGRLVACAMAAVMFLLPLEAAAARRVFGTLLKPISAATVSVETPLGAKAFDLATWVTIKRGQVGLDAKTAGLGDLRPGDYLALSLGDTGKVTDISASFGVVNGKLAGVKDGKVTLSDGRKVPLRTGVQVILADGGLGTLEQLKAGSDITCRVSPASNQAWSIVVRTAGKPVADVAPAKMVAKPRITSLTYEPSADLQPGGALSVELNGTPGGKASFDVMFVMPFTPMKEVSPGCYRAQVKLPAGKTVSNAPLVGYLSVGGIKAPAVQASKLITVAIAPGNVSTPRPVAQDPTPPAARVETRPQSVSTPAVVPVHPAVTSVPVQMVVAKAPEKPRELRQIVLTTPADGAKMKSAIVVKGNASPGSRVAVAITYNNGLTGLLKLAGSVATQTLAVGDDGMFRLGPIALEGPLATKGLRFTIKAYYADREDHGTAVVMAIGDRL